MIRDARLSDAEAIAAIYNDAVLTTTAIWNHATVDVANRRDWLAVRGAAGLPVLVAEGDGQVVGYAAYAPYRPQDGFHATMEHSVYVAPGRQGSGIGRALMVALIDRARASGVHVLVAAIDASNGPSLALHRALGFSGPLVMRQVGQKFGRWLDLALMDLRLDDRPSP